VQVPLTWRFSLGDEPGADLSPSLHWPAPIVTEPPAAHHGPVLVTVEYDVDPTEAEAFADAMSEIERARRRNGAVSWGLFNDTAEPRRWLEFFVDESWVEHLRHHDRVTVADLGAEVTAHGFHRGPTAPVVRHHVAPPSGKRRPRSS
jgi:quinol monooxygenase YgiN